MSVWTLDQAVALYGEDRRARLAEEVAYRLFRYEITCRCGCGNDEISPALGYLWTAGRMLYSKSILVTCGARCLSHNRIVQEKAGQIPNDNSRHVCELAKPLPIWARAIDNTPADIRDIEQLGKIWDSVVGAGGFKHYESRRFFHIDTGESADLRSRRPWRG